MYLSSLSTKSGVVPGSLHNIPARQVARETGCAMMRQLRLLLASIGRDCFLQPKASTQGEREAGFYTWRKVRSKLVILKRR